MTETREAELLAHVPTLATLDKINGFRAQLRQQAEELSSALYAALITQTDRVRR